MAHNINRRLTDNKDAFFSVNEKAWHGLGTVVTEYPNSREALVHAGLDFDVAKVPNVHRLPDGTGGTKDTVSTDSFCTYRTDTNQILGSRLGCDYTPLQNRDAFAFFDAIVGGGDGIMYETAGALGNGERIFITAKLPKYIKIGEGDKDLIEQYIFLTTTHDGTAAVQASFTPVRIVCNNTLRLAMNNCSNTVKIQHSKSVAERVKTAHKIMGLADTLGMQMQDVFNRWAKVRINDAQVKKLIQLAMAPSREVYNQVVAGADFDLSTAFNNTVTDVYAYAMSSPTQQLDTTRGTVFGAYNAVTGYFQNVKKWASTEDKFRNIMNGTAGNKSDTAFNLCMDFAGRGAAALS